MKYISLLILLLITTNTVLSQNTRTTYKDEYGNIIMTSETRSNNNSGFATVLSSPQISYEMLANYAANRQKLITKGNEYYNIGIGYMENNDWENAISNFLNAGQLYADARLKNKEYNYLDVNLAYCYMMIKDKGKSLSYLNGITHSIKKERDWALIIAFIYIELKEFQSAEKICKRIITIDKYHKTAYLMLIDIYTNHIKNSKKLKKIKTKMDKNVF